MGGRVVAGRDIEAEDTDSRRCVLVGQVQGPLEAEQVALEWLGDPDFADRRTDGTEPEAGAAEPVPEIVVLRIGQVQHIGPVDGPELDMPDPVPGEHVDLFLGVLRDLVGKGAEANHRISSGCRTAWFATDFRHDSSSPRNRQGPVETSPGSR